MILSTRFPESNLQEPFITYKPETTVAKLEEVLKPLPTWEEYLAENGPQQGYYVTRNIKDEDPAMIAAFNALVIEFNADRKRIIEQRDLEAIDRYVDRFTKIIYGK